MSPNANLNDVGMYNAGAGGAPPLYLLLPGVFPADAFATATFMSGNVLAVRRLDQNAILVSTQNYPGVDPTAFAFYVQGPNGTFYTQDARDPGGNAQALSYRGTGGNAGTWWVCFEDSSVAGGSDQDFDDSVILCESVNPTPALTTTWGSSRPASARPRRAAQGAARGARRRLRSRRAFACSAGACPRSSAQPAACRSCAPTIRSSGRPIANSTTPAAIPIVISMRKNDACGMRSQNVPR